MEKICTTCHLSKNTETDFYKRSGNTCKSCLSISNKKYLDEHRAEVLARRKKHREANKDRLYAATKQWVEENKEYVAEKKKKYHEAHREKYRDLHRELLKKYPERAFARALIALYVRYGKLIRPDVCSNQIGQHKAQFKRIMMTTQILLM
jgi:hypothetical protein